MRSEHGNRFFLEGGANLNEEFLHEFIKSIQIFAMDQ